ncbi:hypothetical protein [Nocardioides pakistanensis]
MNHTTAKSVTVAAVGLLLVSTAGCASSAPQEDPGDRERTGSQVSLTNPSAGSGHDGAVQPSPASGSSDDATGYDLHLPVDMATLEEVAAEAAEFTGLYASYDYRDSPDERLRDLERYVAKEHMVDLQDAVPVGALADSYRRDRVVTTARVSDVSLEMVSSESALFTIEVKATTSIGGEDTDTAIEYAVTMRKQIRSWAVENLTPVGDGSGAHQH